VELVDPKARSWWTADPSHVLDRRSRAERWRNRTFGPPSRHLLIQRANYQRVDAPLCVEIFRFKRPKSRRGGAPPPIPFLTMEDPAYTIHNYSNYPRTNS
jgi:hypothetical protein